MLVEGVTVEYRTSDGGISGSQVKVIDFDDPNANDWLAVNQFTVTENRNTRRSDVVLFVNGLPLSVIEVKNPADEDATIWTAWQQLQTYKAELPTLFSMNEALMVSDGNEARIGTLTSGREWFKPRRTITGESSADPHLTDLQVMLEGVFEPSRFLSMVCDFIVFDDDGSSSLVKKMAGYHQFHAVKVAVDETLRAAKLQRAEVRIAEEDGRYEAGRKPGGELGDRRIGVVWHTQGSGKSLTMAFYAGAIVREPAMENPTVVVLTDRNDLDDQLFGTFSRCQGLLRQPPAQAESRADLRSKLSVNAGGVVFTTIQKFFPEEKGNTHPHPLGAAEHRGHRRRGPPQPVRLHRRLRPAHEGCAAQRFVCRLYGGRPSSYKTPTRAPCSETTSASTTSNVPSRTGPQCPSTTRAASRSWPWTSRRGRESTRSSRMSPKARKWSEGRSSRPSGRNWRPAAARRSG